MPLSGSFAGDNTYLFVNLFIMYTAVSDTSDFFEFLAGDGPEEHGSGGQRGCARDGVCRSQTPHGRGCQPAQGHPVCRAVPTGQLPLRLLLLTSLLYVACHSLCAVWLS